MKAVNLINNMDNVLAKKLKQLMHDNNISTNQLAKSTGITQPTLHRLLHEQTPDPRISTIKLLADYFAISVNELIENSHQAQAIPVYQINQLNQVGKISPEYAHTFLPVDALITHYHFAVIATESMSPYFFTGAYLIVDPQQALQDGCFCFIFYKQSKVYALRKAVIDGPDVFIQALTNQQQERLNNRLHQSVGMIIQSRFNHL